MNQLQNPLPEPFLLSPWQIQIALLQVRRPEPVDIAPASNARKSRKIIESRNEAAIIEAIFSQSRKASDIVRICGLDRETVRRHLLRLVGAGRVIIKKTAGTAYYRVNRR
jgi:DNA-binding transcriptional ArsR family regulator